MLKHHFTIAALALAISANALAQPVPPEGDDLELPAQPAAPATPNEPEAAPATQPAAATPPVVAESPAPPTAPEPAPSPAAPATPSVAPETDELDRVRISGYLQGEYRYNRLSEDQLQPGGAPLNQNRFLVRRARVRFDRAWDYAAGRLELDANTVSGTTFGIRLAEASLVYRGNRARDEAPLATLTLGVTDIPFGYDLRESTRLRHFMERSLGSLALFPTDADAGLKLSGEISFFRYAVALMNGEPLDKNGFPSDPNNAKDLVGRLGVEAPVTHAVSVWGGTSFAKGRGFHPGRDARKRAIAWRDTDENGTLQPGGSELQGIPATAATPSKNFDRWALGLDLGVEFTTPLGRSKLYAEGFVASNYDRGLFPADPIESSIGNVRHAGAYAALLQDLGEYVVVGFRAGFYDPNSDVLDSTRGKLLPHSQTITTLSPLAGFVLEDRAKLLLQYDFVRDNLARDRSGRPADAENDQLTLRLQVEL